MEFYCLILPTQPNPSTRRALFNEVDELLDSLEKMQTYPMSTTPKPNYLFLPTNWREDLKKILSAPETVVGSMIILRATSAFDEDAVKRGQGLGVDLTIVKMGSTPHRIQED